MADSCNCSAAPRLIFACSGAADVGEVSDRAARQLTRAGVGKMYCLAGIGGAIPGILEQTGLASALLAIDGCPTACVSASLAKAGFGKFTHSLSRPTTRRGRAIVLVAAEPAHHRVVG